MLPLLYASSTVVMIRHAGMMDVLAERRFDGTGAEKYDSS